jgi:hypothetical protein
VNSWVSLECFLSACKTTCSQPPVKFHTSGLRAVELSRRGCAVEWPLARTRRWLEASLPSLCVYVALSVIVCMSAPVRFQRRRSTAAGVGGGVGVTCRTNTPRIMFKQKIRTVRALFIYRNMLQLQPCPVCYSQGRGRGLSVLKITPCMRFHTCKGHILSLTGN